MNAISPNDAAAYLMGKHYRGKKKGSPTTARMNLIGALRAGVLSWKCDEWSEIYTAESGATFNEGPEPKFGLPKEFWRPELAFDSDGWQSNAFKSEGLSNVLIAPAKVRQWMGRNGDGLATVCQFARGVTFDLEQVEAVLGGAGWSSWRAEAFVERKPPARSKPYVSAMIRLIAVALREPEQFDTGSLFRLVQESFRADQVPDPAQIKHLAQEIRAVIALESEPPA